MDNVVCSMAEEVQVLLEVVTDGHQRAAAQLGQERLELVDHSRPRLRQLTQSTVSAAHGLHTKNDNVRTYIYIYNIYTYIRMYVCTYIEAVLCATDKAGTDSQAVCTNTTVCLESM